MDSLRRLFLVCIAGLVLGCGKFVKPIRSIKLAIQLHGKERELFSTHFWFVEFKKDQTYAPSCTIRCKETVEKLGYVNKEAWLELAGVIQAMEFACEQAFGGGPANWYFEMSCLMNHAYRAWPVVPLVHLHFHWRKRGKMKIADYEFPEDSRFGYERTPYTNHEVPADVIEEMKYKMQEKIIEFARLQKFLVTLSNGIKYQ